MRLEVSEIVPRSRTFHKKRLTAGANDSDRNRSGEGAGAEGVPPPAICSRLPMTMGWIGRFIKLRDFFDIPVLQCRRHLMGTMPVTAKIQNVEGTIGLKVDLIWRYHPEDMVQVPDSSLANSASSPREIRRGCLVTRWSKKLCNM